MGLDVPIPSFLDLNAVSFSDDQMDPPSRRAVRSRVSVVRRRRKLQSRSYRNYYFAGNSPLIGTCPPRRLLLPPPPLATVEETADTCTAFDEVCDDWTQMTTTSNSWGLDDMRIESLLEGPSTVLYNPAGQLPQPFSANGVCEDGRCPSLVYRRRRLLLCDAIERVLYGRQRHHVRDHDDAHDAGHDASGERKGREDVRTLDAEGVPHAVRVGQDCTDCGRGSASYPSQDALLDGVIPSVRRG